MRRTEEFKTGKKSPQSPIHDALLSKALARFRSELNDNSDFILDVDSVEELLSQAKALEPRASRSSKLASSLSRFEPMLSQMNDLAAILALCNGVAFKPAGLVWGSLRVILGLANSAGSGFEELVNMLDELSLSLPRFRSYEETLPMNEALESELVDVYSEMICFCARTINFFRKNPHGKLVRLGWPKLNDDFNHTIKRLKKLSEAVDSEAEAIRLRADASRNTELLAAMEALKTDTTQKVKLPCYYVPSGMSEQFYGREDILEKLENTLDPEADSLNKCLVLYGLGGVGKTKIALKYVNSFRDRFDAIFWVSADTSIKLTQDFLEISRRLGLTPSEDNGQDAVAALPKVKAWLAETRCRWLLVFDNADDPEVLVNAWPGGAAGGSILLTSRDSTTGFGAEAESYQVQPFEDEIGVSAFSKLVGRDFKDSSERASAMKIVQALGGLPLAINQISGFIVQQRLSLDDFLPLYERNSAKIDRRKVLRGNYEHTLSTVWELSLDRLSGPSATLQKMLAFFDPDKIHESILLDGSKEVLEDDFEFLGDEMDFFDAKEPLFKAALINRSHGDATLSIHRLVQAAIMKRLSVEERVKYFDCSILLLSNGFPNSWNIVTAHQFSAWEKCELCLPHVNFLITQAKKHKLRPSDDKAFAELILRCCWYLYEKEHYDQARQFMQTAFMYLDQKDQLMYAGALMVQGLIELDTNNVNTALKNFRASLEIREKMLSPDDAFIASSLNAVSIAYTELGDLKEAVEAGKRATDIRLRTASDRIGNSYSNMASTLVRMEKPDEAEDMLKSCPSLKDFTDETFLNTGNPRFSGDMVLLARIRQKQGRLDEAIRLSSKALAFRRSLLGNGLKTCDSLYQVANLLKSRGDLSLAMKFLEESVSIAENLADGKGYLARSNYKLAQVYKALGYEDQSRACSEAAEAIRLKLTNFAPTLEVNEDSYNRLVVWMLW